MNHTFKARHAAIARWHCSVTNLRDIIATWRERSRFRGDLEQISRDNSYLIDDIGLTKRQVEAELAKSFWQV
ncbi:DUF1127 domain-containing protein [Phyllobacterium endophyticum]|uniref:DUF1127 domain-containing protein n=1 Tax=Phyllobacterium endophyticum TaxID=1149773 RepID=UPI0011C740A4|nr:DUF1127 domain-containing protein [Phyllobacterium endophyticum]TXR47659.1 DUF1127 domain-containing protein [Phyllobacterium endophyticum]